MEKRVSFSQFQKLGKVLMTPVMILPIAGILVGIGSAFTTKNIVALWPVLGNTYVKLFFNLFKAMGNTINSYLPIIFAVSVAIGYAEKEKGIAALSSVIGFLAMNNVMNILLTSLGILDPSAMKTGQSMVMGIASLAFWWVFWSQNSTISTITSSSHRCLASSLAPSSYP